MPETRVLHFPADSIGLSSFKFHDGLRKRHSLRNIVHQLQGRWRSLKVVDFGTNRYRVCDFLLVINIATLVLSCTVSEIRRLIDRKRQFSLHHSDLMPSLEIRFEFLYKPYTSWLQQILVLSGNEDFVILACVFLTQNNSKARYPLAARTARTYGYSGDRQP